MLITNKINGFTVSVSKDSNKIISSSEDSFAGIKPGSYIKIGNVDLLYSVLNSRKFSYIKEFELLDSKTIQINCDTKISLQREDVIKIIYDEYKLGTILNIINPGQYYKLDDILTVKNGELSIDISSGIGYPTKLKVEEVGEFGGVMKLISDSDGKYIVPPQGKIEVFGDSGENLLLELDYKLIENRNIQERVIKNVEFKDNKTIIILDYSLPIGIKKGTLSTEKWEITLMTEYQGNSSLNVPYKVFNDFSPNYSFPLTVKNNPDMHTIFNKAILDIDKKIKELEDKIK